LDYLYEGAVFQYVEELMYPDMSIDPQILITREKIIISTQDIVVAQLDCREWSTRRRAGALADNLTDDSYMKAWILQDSITEEETINLLVNHEANMCISPEKEEVKALNFWISKRIKNFLFTNDPLLTEKEKVTIAGIKNVFDNYGAEKMSEAYERQLFSEKVIKSKNAFAYHPFFRELLSSKEIRKLLKKYWKNGEEDYESKYYYVLKFLKLSSSEPEFEQAYLSSDLNFKIDRLLVNDVNKESRKEIIGHIKVRKLNNVKSLFQKGDMKKIYLSNLIEGVEAAESNSNWMSLYLNLCFPGSEHLVTLKPLTSEKIGFLNRSYDEPNKILEMLEDLKEEEPTMSSDQWESKQEKKKNIEDMDDEEFMAFFENAEVKDDKSEKEPETNPSELSKKEPLNLESTFDDLNASRRIRQQIMEMDEYQRRTYDRSETEKIKPVKNIDKVLGQGENDNIYSQQIQEALIEIEEFEQRNKESKELLSSYWDDEDVDPANTYLSGDEMEERIYENWEDREVKNEESDDGDYDYD